MARIEYQKRQVDVPDREMRGQQLFQELGVSPDRDLVVVRPNGNFLVQRDRKVRPVDGDYFVDAPTFEYGADD
ncbi:MAG: hypothetical protein P8189_18775 [Anaerolineae bacterium]|jgi:hypothetical protein